VGADQRGVPIIARLFSSGWYPSLSAVRLIVGCHVAWLFEVDAGFFCIGWGRLRGFVIGWRLGSLGIAVGIAAVRVVVGVDGHIHLVR